MGDLGSFVRDLQCDFARGFWQKSLRYLWRDFGEIVAKFLCRDFLDSSFTRPFWQILPNEKIPHSYLLRQILS